MTKTGDQLADYYARRAHEYERIYEKPERREDLRKLRGLVCSLLTDHDVLEVACGTGYWTEAISHTARSILATDVNDEVLQIARSKRYEHENVRFAEADAFTLDSVAGRLTAAFAGFWWSHILLNRIAGFLSVLHARLQPGALVVFFDNNYVEGSITPICRMDAEGNTYQMRELDEGNTYEVLKNFPTETQLRQAVAAFTTSINYGTLTYYWCLSYQLP